MNAFDVINNIKTTAKRAAARSKYSKSQFLEKSATIPEVIELKKPLRDKSFADELIAGMPEKSFCEIVEVKECEGNKGKCSCTKVMVFGEDSINGKVCERFTISSSASRCIPGKIDMTGRCIASSDAGSCDAPLPGDSAQIILEQQATIELLRGKLKELYDVAGVPYDF
jgi:hypothetical protein